MSKRHISLKDLAKELGVSISTVSRALKNHPEISPELTKKIQALAAKWNYTPNPLAMGLLRQQTKMIGVIVPDINTHFYSSIISGIESVAKERGYFIVIASSNESMEKEIESVENLLKSRVEGFIVCLSQETNHFSHFEKLIKNEIPLVFLIGFAKNYLYLQYLQTGRMLPKKITKHFYENGCKRIAYISGPEHLNISQNRKEGYLDGLKECDLKYDEDLLVHCNLSIEDAKLATQQLLQLENKPDAIFGVNDTIAFAAMIEVKKQGYKIPDDILLAGFTDEFHSIVVDPPLTSVSHPTFRMGEEAAKLFFESVEKEKNINKRIMLPIDLVVRESSIKK